MTKPLDNDERPLVFRTQRPGRPKKFFPGQVHGVLELLEFVGYRYGKVSTWKCRCRRCGAELLASQPGFYRGPRRCRHCPKKEHGQWVRWKKMVARCHDPDSPMYAQYGGAGIEVCPAWRESLDAFVRDMGQHPPGKPFVGRRDPRGPYSPENCFWSETNETLRTNPHNRLVTVGSLTLRTSSWAALCGITRQRMCQRFDKFPPEAAIAPYESARWAVEQATKEQGHAGNPLVGTTGRSQPRADRSSGSP